MNADFRLSVDHFDHPKIIKLRRRLGESGVLAHLRLLGFTAKWKPSGELTSMDNEEIALAAGWHGDADEFVRQLVELRLLDDVEGTYAVHDWAEHNPFAASHSKRSDAARQNARKRWDKKAGVEANESEAHANGNANGIPNGNPLTLSSPTVSTPITNRSTTIHGVEPTKPDQVPLTVVVDDEVKKVAENWANLKGLETLSTAEMLAIREAVSLPGMDARSVIGQVGLIWEQKRVQGKPPETFHYFLPALKRQSESLVQLSTPVTRAALPASTPPPKKKPRIQDRAHYEALLASGYPLDEYENPDEFAGDLAGLED